MHKFQRKKPFPEVKNEILCIELANVDEPTRHKNGVKYLLVRQDLCGRTVDAKRMTVKDSKETVCSFLCIITKKNRPKGTWVDNRTEFAGDFNDFCRAEGIQIYSTMSRN